MFVTSTERLYDFSKYRKPSILFNGIRKSNNKLVEASCLQSKFKHELSDVKKAIKAEKMLL